MQSPCKNAYRALENSFHTGQTYNAIPKVKCLFPAAVGSSCSSLSCDSLQRLVYHSLQSQVYKHGFFSQNLLWQRLGKQCQENAKWRQETNKRKNPSFLYPWSQMTRNEHFSHDAPLNTSPQSGTEKKYPFAAAKISSCHPAWGHAPCPNFEVSFLFFFFLQDFILFTWKVWLMKDEKGNFQSRHMAKIENMMKTFQFLYKEVRF